MPHPLPLPAPERSLSQVSSVAGFLLAFLVGFLATSLLIGCGSDGPAPKDNAGTGGAAPDVRMTIGSGGAGASPAEAGTGGAGPPAASTAVAAEQVCTELSRAACEAEQACCTTAVAGADALASCVSQQTARCRGDLQSIATDRRAGYDPAVGAQMVAKFRSISSTCDLGLLEWASSRNGLLSMFAGTVASGGACLPADMNDGGAVMSCDVPSICHVTGVGQTKLSGTCDVVRGSSAPCVIDTECDPQQQLRCDFDSPVPGGVVSPLSEKNLGLHGHCVPRLADGSKCARATECSSLLCDTSKACVPRTTNRVYCVSAT